MTTPRTIIEFIEPIADPSNPLCHKAKEVRVNGIPVLVKEGGIDITFGPIELTTVTLELLATEIHFRAAEPYEEPPTCKSHDDLVDEMEGWRNAARAWQDAAETAQVKLKEAEANQ